MTIDMINSQYSNLFLRNNISKMFGNAKVVSNVKVANEKISKEASVSISKESKDMLDKMNECKTEKESELLSEDNDFTVASSNNNKAANIHNTCTFAIPSDQYYGRLGSSAYNYSEETGMEINMSGFASMYAEIYQEIELNYTGEEQEKQFAKLESAYDDALESMAYGAEKSIWVLDLTVGLKNIENLDDFLGISLARIIRKLKMGENQTSMESVGTLIEFIKNSIMRTGELARQYIREGRAVPNTIENKSDFASYLKENTKFDDGVILIGLGDFEELNFESV